jgi:hypothetical protein
MRRVYALCSLLMVTACAGEARQAHMPRSRGELLPVEEHALSTAVEKKRAGDPFGAWALIENIPASSPARLDPRYDEVMGAWADARTTQLGEEITGARPSSASDKVETSPSADPPPVLDERMFERFVSARRASLRDACFGEYGSPTSFVITVRVDAGGRVLDAMLSSVNGDSNVAECVGSRLRSWTFPQNAHGAVHRTMFVFGR